jgi:hypothetical protein
MAAPLPRVLVSNDDGIDAPGLRELVAALAAAACCELYVAAPSGERSAQSHAITLQRCVPGLRRRLSSNRVTLARAPPIGHSGFTTATFSFRPSLRPLPQIPLVRGGRH